MSSSMIFIAITISSTLIILSAIIYLLYYLWFFLLHKSRTRTSPFDAVSPFHKLQKFSYRELKSATNNFSCSNSIGKGGSGTVFRGILRDGKLVAVKLLDSSLLQSEHEFQNELKILGGLKSCPLIVSLLGFCVERGERLVVYEYMPNRSLQESLFSDCCNDNLCILSWGMRFNVILDVANALAFLHLGCEPPVIHGDVKPSNVLLDCEFRAKLSDFGLSRLKVDDEVEIGVDLFSQDLGKRSQELVNENETPPIGTPLESQDHNDEVDFALALQASNSSKNSRKVLHNVKGMGLAVDSLNFGSEGGNSHLKGKELSRNENGGEVWNKFVPYDDEFVSSVDHSKELSLSVGNVGDDDSSQNACAKQWGKDWWWKQDGSGELCSKDYVMEWIGSQICPDPDKADWDEEKGAIQERNGLNASQLERHDEVNKNDVREHGFECLNNGGIEKEDSKKHRKMHEWWREENLEEIRKKCNEAKRVRVWNKERLKVPHFGLGKFFEFTRRRRTKFGQEKDDDGDDKNVEFSFRLGYRKKNHSRSMGSDMWSGDLFSRELSSTTSMRGTLCYVAPEYQGYGYLMEKADIYSLGVLILVIISGRRPLHVLASPMKLEKANLISWVRSLAHSGDVLELVDERLKEEYDKERASLCINLALACLQKMPELRPDIGDIVRILKGEMEIPQLPIEFSPSPPSRAFSRSRRKRKGGLD